MVAVNQVAVVSKQNQIAFYAVVSSHEIEVLLV